MAWNYFPLSAGTWLKAEHLNELGAAALSRGLNPPDDAESGWWSPKIASYLSSLTSAINSAIDGGAWWWIESYTSSSSYSMWKLTRSATNSQSIPKVKNVFELAFDDSSTSWNHSVVSGYITEVTLNDIYRVLSVMTVCKIDSSSGSWGGVTEARLANTLLNLDSASWGSGSISGNAWINHSVLFAFSQWGQERYAVAQGFVVPSGVLAFYPTIQVTSRTTRSGGSARTLACHASGDYSDMPTVWGNVPSWGSSLGTFSFATGTGNGTSLILVPKIANPAAGTYRIGTYPSDYDASGSGLSSTSQKEAIERNTSGSMSIPVMVELDV